MNNNYNEYEDLPTIDDGVTNDLTDPVLAQFQTAEEQQHWGDELVASRKEREPFNKRGAQIIKRYSDERDTQSRASHYNLFFANTERKMSALYARTPQPDIRRRFNEPDDQVSRVAANILERNLSYELETEAFDSKIKQMLFDRLVPGVGIGWARLDQTEGDPDIDSMTGLPIPNSHIKEQLADIDYVAWDDFLWAPCRVWSECPWVARRIPMSKDDVKQRFSGTIGQDTIKSLAYAVATPLDAQPNNDNTRPKYLTTATVDVYEIWDKTRGLIFWICESCDKPLDVQRDTNEFPGFFPTPLPPMCRTTTSSTTPISDFALVQDLYNELDSLHNRGVHLIRALQAKFVYDPSNEALKTLFTSASELEGVPVKDWAVNITDKGGVNNAMQFVDLRMLSDTYTAVVNSKNLIVQQIMEVEGISDFERGVMQPYVTAAASQATSQATSARLTNRQMEVADYIQRLLRLKAHLICKFYTPQTMMERVGQLPAADMQYVPQALQSLSNEQLRNYRLEVSVDSIQQLNWNQEKAEKNEALQAVTALFSQIMPAAQQTPQVLPLGVQLLKWLISDYKGAKTLEGTLDTYLDQLTQQAAQKQQQPPAPTPEQTKMQMQMAQNQSDMQIAQIKAQSDQAIAQVQAQVKAMALQIEALNAQTKARKASAEIARDQAHTHIAVIEGAHDQAMDVAGMGVQ